MRFLLSIVAAIASCTLLGEVTVVVRPGADKAVRAAADAFAECHEKVTGLRPAVAEKAEGEGPFVRIAVDEKAFDGVTDAYRIRSRTDGLELTGRNGRSAIYAVYDFFRIRCGAAYFWDGDIFAKADRIDFSGLDVFEQSRFEYRGCQYFAHRGLTRFQAEHWGLADWKREIDWALKNRLNVIMLRIGVEDLFQLAFPDVVPYPDVSVTAESDCEEGYNYRTPFWSLQYRHLLRKAVVDYATDRGLMHPVEYGTMTHWFSRTPQSFLDAMKPDFVPQIDLRYDEPSGRVWDVRKDTWFDAYWKLTEAAMANYGYSGLMFNPGFDERTVYSNREDNVRFKIDIIDRFNREAARRRPDAKLLLEGWDLFLSWKPEEVERFTRTADPSRTVIWDFTADEDGMTAYPWIPKHNNFTLWGVTNRFPYAFGYMLAFERGMDIRGNYEQIRARERAIRDDPMCKGYLIWPENSHTDIFAWRYFTDNCWRLSPKSVGELLHDFCRDRYGAQAPAFERAWSLLVPHAAKAGWGRIFSELTRYAKRGKHNDPGRWTGAPEGYAEMPYAEILRATQGIDWTGDMARRDAVDLVRTVLDRRIVFTFKEMMKAYHACAKGDASAAARVGAFGRETVRLTETMGEVLALHADYSLSESLDRLDAVERLRNPRAEHLLFENAACDYCCSHQVELVRGWYVPFMRHVVELLSDRVARQDFSLLPPPPDFRDALRQRAHPLRDFAPDPSFRTAEAFRSAVRKALAIVEGAGDRFSEDFETGLHEWTAQGVSAEVVRGEGRGGSAALRCTKGFTKTLETVSRELQLRPGRRYLVTVFVRTADLRCNQRDLDGIRFSVRHCNAAGRSVLHEQCSCIVDTAGGWARATVLTERPANAVGSRLILRLPACVAGTAYFDDITVEEWTGGEPGPSGFAPSAAIDEHGRLIADGKPFFPLGMYFEKWDPPTASNLSVYAEAPFNCLLPYAVPDRGVMDLCAARGLKVVYNAIAYYGTRWAFGAIGSEKEDEDWIRARVAEFRDHPALLCWYINDEYQRGFKDRLDRRYRTVRELDSAHPVWGVMQAKDAAWFQSNTDIFGVDPYPIADARPEPDLRTVHDDPCRVANLSGKRRAVWSVIQAFDWGGYAEPEPGKGSRPPTRAELSAMTWLAIAGGANGIFYLGFTPLSFCVNGQSFETRWPEVRAVAAEVKAAEEILVSEPGPRPVGVAYPLCVRTWRTPQGTVALAANGSRRPLKETVRLEDSTELQVELEPLGHRLLALPGWTGLARWSTP